MFYTGIGSRNTPNPILGQMIKIAYFLNTHEFTLRFGGAGGADSAFEAGVDQAPNPTLKEIYLPYQNFNNRRSALFSPSDQAYQLAEKYHPRWHKLSPVVKALMPGTCTRCWAKILTRLWSSLFAIPMTVKTLEAQGKP